MANLMALNGIYNHYLTTYARSSTSKYDTHKKSELRNIYNSIVKLNKDAPIFLPSTSRDSQAYAIGIKEGARELHNTIASLGGLDSDELLNKKIAYSSNENIVSAQYIGTIANNEEVPSFDIEVRSLASPQVNLGKFLPSDEMDLAENTYSFDINIHNMNYEFQYNVSANDTNKGIQERLARLINGAEIGIEATVETEDGLSALKLSSTSTGATFSDKDIFSVSDTHSSKASGSVDYLGIGEVTRPSSNAEIVINGIERSVSANHFTLEKTYELVLNGISPTEGETASVSVKNDTESLSENIQKLVDGYNSFLSENTVKVPAHTRGNSLLREMRAIASAYQDGLNQLGLNIEKDGSISLNENAYRHALTDNDMYQTAGTVKGFANSLLRKSNQISLNPMQYIDRTVVAYKRPFKNFPTPYITSPYSGMLFNSYC